MTAKPWARASRQVLHACVKQIAPLLDACGDAEMHGLLSALDGRFVPAGPSGAPSRGRLDVRPLGAISTALMCNCRR